VASVIVNQNNEILMMQEAKQSCAGNFLFVCGPIQLLIA